MNDKTTLKLKAALQLAKDMIIANEVSLPHTMEVINDALAEADRTPLTLSEDLRTTIQSQLAKVRDADTSLIADTYANSAKKLAEVAAICGAAGIK